MPFARMISDRAESTENVSIVQQKMLLPVDLYKALCPNTA
jgi:hypothetical protein